MKTDDNPPDAMPTPSWYVPTPGKLIAGLTIVELGLVAAGRFEWLGLRRGSGDNVLLAVAILVVGLAIGLVWCLGSLVLRRRFQFGLRGLLMLVLVVAVVGGLFAHRMRTVRRQNELIELLREAGAEWTLNRSGFYFDAQEEEWLHQRLGKDFFHDIDKVCYASDDVEKAIVTIESIDQMHQLRKLVCRGHPITDSFLSHFKGQSQFERLDIEWTLATDSGLALIADMRQLKRLSLSGTNISDDGMVHLAGLTQLEELDLTFTKISDDGLKHLAGLARVEAFSLSNVPVTGEGFKHLKGMTRLRELTCWDTQFNDVGLMHLAELTQLEILRLDRTNITDAGLVHLKGMTRLSRLDLSGTKVTDTGIVPLLHALPNVHYLDLSDTQVTMEAIKPFERNFDMGEIDMGEIEADH